MERDEGTVHVERVQLGQARRGAHGFAAAHGPLTIPADDDRGDGIAVTLERFGDTGPRFHGNFVLFAAPAHKDGDVDFAHDSPVKLRVEHG